MAADYYDEMYSLLRQPEGTDEWTVRMFNPTYSSMNRINTAGARLNQLRALQQQKNLDKMYDPAFWNAILGGGTSASAPTPTPAYSTSRYDNQLEALMANPDSIANSGAYKFRLGQGNQAIQRSAAAKGMLGSGNTLAALLEYGQGQASQEYGSQMDRLSALRAQDIGAQTAMRGQDIQLQAQREAAQAAQRNAFAQMMLGQFNEQATTARKNLNSGGNPRFY